MEIPDRRVKRTKHLLHEALVTLTLEKGYDAVSIQDLTDRADIGYRTFFRHYADKDALLRDVLENMLLDLRALMTPPPLEVFLNPALEVSDYADSSILFNHCRKHADLYRVFLRSERKIMESIMAFAVAQIRQNFGNLPHSDIPFELVANQIVGGTFAMIGWWLDNGMQETAEKMGEYHARLILNPVRRTVLESLPA
jgi:AcrR family transcriptional regulator